MLLWSLTGEQKYIDAASELLDYKMGLNPLGISYVTHLGFHQVHNPHDRESAYTAGLGLGPKPGITVFGPGVIGRRTANIYTPAMQTCHSHKHTVRNHTASCLHCIWEKKIMFASVRTP